MNAPCEFPLPPYFALPPPSAQVFGKLRKTTHKAKGVDTAIWEIEADPNVIVMAKRLFPGSEGRGAGIAKFPANRRAFGELVWFLLRFPLEIENRDEFMRDYADATAYVVKREEIQRRPSVTLPDALFTGKLREFQQQGLDWCLLNKRTLLADGMGLGKTVQALAFLATAQKWPSLIVPPSHLVRHWERFVSQFLNVASSADGALFAQGKPLIHVIRGTKEKELPDAHLYIIHYLLLRSWRNVLRELAAKRIVFDEIQELRHDGTEKYSAASEIASAADEVLGLSGTPIYNHGGEIWNVLNIVEYHCLGDYDSFSREWCHGYGSDVVKEPVKLNDYLRREGLMLRRRKEDVLKDLPPKDRIIESVDSDEGLFAKFVGEAIKLAKGAQAATSIYQRGRMEQQAIEQTRLATGVAKAHSVAAFVKGMLDAEEPTLVFAHHHAVVDILMHELREHNPVAITGRETETQKDESQRAFQAGESKVCIVSLRAATGLDGLQGVARIVVFAELDWAPAVHAQAEDRAHRDGQKNHVLCYYLVSDAGTDPEVMEALGFKISQFVGIMGDRPATEDDKTLSGRAIRRHTSKILAKLRNSAPRHREAATA